jgi:hypothetical protein
MTLRIATAGRDAEKLAESVVRQLALDGRHAVRTSEQGPELSISELAMKCWEQGRVDGIGLAIRSSSGSHSEFGWQSAHSAACWSGETQQAQFVLDDVLQWQSDEAMFLPVNGDTPNWKFVVADECWRDLFTDNIVGRRVGDHADNSVPRVIFPGSFRPLHQGHRKMVEVAEGRLGHRVELEVSVCNVDKPTLDFFEIESRLAAISGFRPIWLTRAATFLEKTNLFPQTTFLVGEDTIRRIVDVRYFEDVSHQRQTYGKFVERGCRFLIFGRSFNGEFCTITPAELPPELRRHCNLVPEAEFREDISSSGLRNRPS